MTTGPERAPVREGELIDGFVVKAVDELPHLRAQARLLEHVATGARVMHVCNDDTENLFSITFPTPPPDDTGLPHILEHAVLDGSERYPVRRPFFEMIKMSMATFINAMTGGDRTMYPVASNVQRDLLNLAEVYFDAVFHPTLSRQTFMQEGHSLAFATKGDVASDLAINGIVYNEMKGAFSNPDAVVGRRMIHALLPDTPYSRESGGDPDHIPELTYEQFVGFHRTYYHPSNAYFVFYGNIPTRTYLAFLAERLAGYTRREVDVSVVRQPRWAAPKRVAYSYPIGAAEKTADKAYLVMCWLASDGADVADALAMHVLELALIGNQAAPLRRAIVESAIGQDLSHSGFYTLGREGIFSIGVKGSEIDRAERFERLVTDTLRRIAGDGLGRDRIESAFRQMSYRYLEIQSMFPLHVMFRIQDAWLAGAPPLSYVMAHRLLEELNARHARDEHLFENLIRQRLLANTHRLTVSFQPDTALQAAHDAAVTRELAARKAAMTPDELALIVRTAADLERMQSTPNSPEAIATLPQLAIGDLPAKPRHIPTAVERVGEAELLVNDVFANGVSYLQVDVPLERLECELLPYLALYADCVHKMGAAGQDYTRIAERVAAHTDGVSFWTFCGTGASDPERLIVRGRFGMKSLDGQLGEGLKLLRDMMLELEFRDAVRLRDVVNQRRAELRGSLAYQGSALASSHAARGLGAAAYATDLIRGLPQFRLVDSLAGSFDQHHHELVSRLERIREHIRSCGTLTVSFTGAPGCRASVAGAFEHMLREMRRPAGGASALIPPTERPRAGLAAPMDVAHCALAIPSIHLSHPDAPALGIGGRLLSLDYLLEEIRVKGGAYGASCHHDALGSSWRFSSFNDPSIARTLDVFRASREFVRAASWSRGDIDRAIIGSAKSAEEPIRPDSATGHALHRHVIADTPRLREARYARMLETTPAAVKRVLEELLETGLASAGVCVVSGRKRLEDANRQLGEAAGLDIDDILTS